jgi:hypothetical protein
LLRGRTEGFEFVQAPSSESKVGENISAVANRNA